MTYITQYRKRGAIFEGPKIHAGCQQAAEVKARTMSKAFNIEIEVLGRLIETEHIEKMPICLN